MTEEQKKAALAEALKKRQAAGGPRKAGPDMSAAVKEQEQRKKNAKAKADKEGRDRWAFWSLCSVRLVVIANFFKWKYAATYLNFEVFIILDYHTYSGYFPVSAQSADS